MTCTAAPSSDVAGALSSSAAIARVAGNSSKTDTLYRTPTNMRQKGRLRRIQQRRFHEVPDIPLGSRIVLFHILISWFARQYGKREGIGKPDSVPSLNRRRQRSFLWAHCYQSAQATEPGGKEWGNSCPCNGHPPIWSCSGWGLSSSPHH